MSIFSPVSPPIASPPSSSNIYIYHTYQGAALTFILVSILPILYCILWCSLHVAILDCRRRRQLSVSVTADTEAFPLQVCEQPRQQYQQEPCSNIDGKGELNPECPICLEEAEAEVDVEAEAEAEADAEAEAEAGAETEAVSWQLVPECNHRFHELCLNRWLKLSRTCPLCRVTTQLEAYVSLV